MGAATGNPLPHSTPRFSNEARNPAHGGYSFTEQTSHTRPFASPALSHSRLNPNTVPVPPSTTFSARDLPSGSPIQRRHSYVPTTPRQTYVAAPTPPGISYPDPLTATPSRAADRVALPPSMAGSPVSTGSRTPHQRSKSLYAGMTPMTSSRFLPPSSPNLNPNPNDPRARKSSLRHVPSNASIASSARSYHQRYDANTYLDPAFNVSSESLVDPATVRNTMANAARTAEGIAVPVRASPARVYLAMP